MYGCPHLEFVTELLLLGQILYLVSYAITFKSSRIISRYLLGQSLGGSGYVYLVPYAVAFVSLENITALFPFRSEPGWERVRVPGALCRGLRQPGEHNSTVSL